MNTAYFFLTPQGEKLAGRLSAGHPGVLYGKEHFKENLQEAFSKYDNLVCIMATAVIAAVSVRRRLFPRVTGIKPAFNAASTS